MRMIWATRGRSWGFRFLRDGGLSDPLPAYDAAFAGASTGLSVFHRAGTTVAARFPDPNGRKDAAGRVIPHDVVIFLPESDEIASVDDVRERVWPLLADEYEASWGREKF